MNQILAAFLLTIAVVSSAINQVENKANDNATRELMELERELSDGLIKQDVTVLDRLWSDDLVFTFPDGKVSRKAQRLAKPATRPVQSTAEATVNDEIKVYPYGDTAVVTVLSTWKGRTNNQEFIQQYQATHVWVKQQGGWQLVAAHVSQVKK